MHNHVFEPQRNEILAVHEPVKVALRAHERLEEGDERREESTGAERA